MTMIRVRRRHKSTDVVVDDDDYDVGRPSTSMASSATTTTTSSDDVVGDSDHLRFRRAGLVQDFKSVSMRVRDRSWNRNRRLKTESDSDSDSDSESTNSDSWPDSRDGEPIERRREPAKPTESTGRPRDDEMFAPRRIRRRKNSADVDVEKMKKTCSRRSRQPMFASGLLFLLVAFTAFGACRAIREVRCPTIDIRNNPDGLVRKSFYSLGDTPDVSPTSCTVVEGSFVIAMVTNKNRNVSYPRFENLREITGSLLVFSAAGLKNLSSVLPKLRVIGGQHLVQHYAFVVFQNDDLEELGLWNLSLIRNGGVRIANNRLLCGATSIDWKRIAASKLNDIVVDNSVEASYTETGKICDSGNCQNDPDKDNPKCRYLGLTHGAQLQSCWDRNHCQRECAYDRDNEAAGPGCDPEGRRCHEECVGGCEVAGDATRCHACKRLNFKGRCVSKCPPELYSLLNRRCVTRAQCKKLYSENNRPLKAINGLCSARCPENYEEDPSNPSECLKCQTACQVTCAGNVTIDSYARALTLKGCHIIDGWLSVEIRAGLDAAGTVEFSEAFHKIHTIKGYLMIFHTPSFLNLFMFKSLRRITGEILYQRKYALSVFENTSIRKLFDPSLNLIIDEGALQFHNNRMLCFRQIMQLMEKLGRENEMNDADQSRSSNGDKAICEDSTFDVNVTAVSHHNFLLEWPAFNTSDMDHRKFLGYEVFYKEVQRVDKNMSIDDDRSACSDSWFSEFVERDKNELSRVSTLVSNHVIKPNTIYAFYVSTQIVHHPGARNAISSIGFVQTNFTVPEPPKINQYTATAGDITIEWDPPSKPNGVITHYVVSWRQMEPDLEYYSSMACEATTNERLQSLRPDATPTAVGGDQATASSTAAPTLTSFIAGQVAKEQGGTCSTLPGCCECNKPMSVEQTEDETNFENEVHNAVFVQNCDFDPERCRQWRPTVDEDDDELAATSSSSSATATSPSTTKKSVRLRRDSDRRRRHTIRNTIADFEAFSAILDYRMVAKRRRRAIEASPETSTVVEVDDVKDEQLAGKEKGKKPRVRVPSTKNALGGESGASSSASTPTSFVDEVAKSVKRVEDKKIADRMWRENVTAAPENSRNKFVIKGLKHFTEYSISVSACQDLKVRDNYCSQARRAQKTIRTQRLPDVDEVRNETIHIEKINSTTSTVRITWEPPEAPNGGVIGYRVTLENALVEAAPHQTCQESYDGNWTSAVDGVLFKNLADGDYRVEVVTIAMGGLSKASTPSDVITIHTPGFWTLRNSILVATSVTLVLLIIGIIAYYFVRKYYGAKVKEYATQLISANPDYLSQQDVYKADEWELKRTDVTIQEEIGRGTFGSVFRGFGHNVKSQCGEIFGQCAIKTVTETASNAERLHFLLEANVMKTFNSSFIVKLYGVVSDGQPVLVVMEMMAKGNLRDYLRARRPGAEENTENLPVPTKEQYCEWAAQIADGMAYLESIRFCHRDLAARNCMVAADDVVKIGDFGMARDLYYHEYYKPTGKRLMPVRWMAPESLKDGKFDSKSDMWSYGIVLYEMLTLGQQPYQGLANDEVLNFIGMSRKVLEQPEECPNSWYEVMKLCWKYSPRDRPTFAQLVRRLAVDASPEFHRLAYVMNTPFDPVNDGHLGEGDGHDFDDRQAEGAIGVEVLNDDDEDDDDVDDDDDDDDDDDEPVYVVEPGTQAIQMKELKSKYSSNASLIGDDGDYISHGEDSQGNSGYTSNRGESDEPTWGDDERMAMMGDHERP